MMPREAIKGLMERGFSADESLTKAGQDQLRSSRPVDLAHSPPFRIGSVEVRPGSREVLGGNRREVLEPRVMQVLVALASAQGKILSRDDLIEACWEGRAVCDDAVNRVISRLRALSRTFASIQVETINKVGYRLALEAPDARPDAAAAEPRPDDGSAIRRICVLPFANMSGDAEQEYFSDGISEDITTDLSKVSALAVTARNAAFAFKGQEVDVRDVARTLGVSHVLEGSVRKSAERVRITAQLIDGATGDHVWAERYDRDLTDIFAIQDEISKAIVEALKVKLLPEERKAIEQHGTTSAEAYSLYLMARKDWMTGNYGDVRRDERVVRICQAAIEIDADYARAWALMALAQANLLGLGRPGDGGLAAAERALSIDPGIAEAHCVLVRHLWACGRNGDADSTMAVALRLDPESWEVNREAGRLRTLQRRLPEAIRHYQKEVSVMDSDFYGWAMLMETCNAVGDCATMRHAAAMTLERAERSLAHDASNGNALSCGAGALAALGQAERAREWIKRGLLVDPDNLNMRYNLACILTVHLNDPEQGLAMLGPVLESAGGMMVRLAETDVDLDSLRDDPRFQKLMSKAMSRVGAGKAAAGAA